MSHKEKICTPALAMHVEQCFPSFSYAPLVIGYRKDQDGDRAFDHTAGLRHAVEMDIAEHISPRIQQQADQLPKPESLAKAFIKAGKKALCGCDDPKRILDSTQLKDIQDQLAATIDKRQAESLITLQQELITQAGPGYDLSRPNEAFDSRLDDAITTMDLDAAQQTDFVKPHPLYNREIPQLGMFFSEATCFRCEGITYQPCGKESTILPGESVSEAHSNQEQFDQELSETSTESTTLKQTTKVTNDETLAQSYAQTVKKTTDINKSTKGSIKGKLFNVLDINLADFSASASFKKIIETLSKSSSTQNRTFLNEVVNDIKTSTSLTSSSALKTMTQSEYKRKLANTGDQPMHVIERQPFCVNSVIHKRTNVQLAWSACIDEPGRDLCRPDTLRENYAEDIQHILDKWAATPAPGSFGPRPQNTRVCSETFSSSKHGPFGGRGKTRFQESMSVAIPPGHTYVAGTADIEMLGHSTDLVSQTVLKQPGHGTSGAGFFEVKIVVDNKLAHKERISYRVCFEVRPDAADEYDRRLSLWRKDQADAEVNAFLAGKEQELAEFLLSDRISGVIEKRILEDYFGIDSITDCCALIRRIRRVFDFDALCFSLLPSWNDLGERCQTTDPVTIYTARCMQFYLPVIAGKEWEALGILLAIKAIPNSPYVLSQIAGYINSIRQMRQNLFSRAFDPSGWEVKIDGPNGYTLTPYDSDSPDWNAEFETLLNFQLIDVTTVTVPCGGTRKELRPNIC